MPAAVAKQKITLTVPEDLADIYTERGMKTGKTVEQEMIARLDKCRSHTDLTPIYLTDAQRSHIAVITGKLMDAPSLIKFIEQTVEIKVGDVAIALDSALLHRLQTRTFRGDTLAQVIEREVLRGLREFCGL